jgi:ribonuclease-3
MDFKTLQETTNIHFTNENLLKQAFYHRSYLNEAKHIKESNERLEFLGDAILSFLTSKHLYNLYPQHPEGILTNIRSSVVKTTSLGNAAKNLGFGDLLFLSKGEEEGGGRKNISLLADSFEAYLGALCLDQGLDSVELFLQNHLFPTIETIVANKSYIDFKSFLQEIIQETHKISPSYVVQKTEGPDHDRTFWIEVSVGKNVLGEGVGKSKQEGEQQAAKNALEKMGKL